MTQLPKGANECQRRGWRKGRIWQKPHAFPRKKQPMRIFKAQPQPPADFTGQKCLSSHHTPKKVTGVHLSDVIEKSDQEACREPENGLKQLWEPPRALALNLRLTVSSKRYISSGVLKPVVWGRTWLWLWLLGRNCGMVKLPSCLSVSRRITNFMFL